MSDLAARLLNGDRRALARAITLVENDDPSGREIVASVYSDTGKAATIGVTGPPGAGKSTLISALTRHARAREVSVGVLSIDPSSPFTDGALLGDRIRLTDHFLDPGVFIRSMASRGALGGLAEAALQATLLMDASGCETIVIETVGVGQAEIAVINYADTVVLVLVPGSGDSIQALKAGVMEVPDIIAVNKADHPLAESTVREIRDAISLGPPQAWTIPILLTEAVTGQGIDELASAIASHRACLIAGGALRQRRRLQMVQQVITIATQRLRKELDVLIGRDEEVRQALERAVAGEVDPTTIADEVIEHYHRCLR